METKRPNGWALIPFLVFAAFYVGLSLYAGRCGFEMPWYKVPMPIAFLVASAKSEPSAIEAKLLTEILLSAVVSTLLPAQVGEPFF